MHKARVSTACAGRPVGGADIDRAGGCSYGREPWPAHIYARVSFDIFGACRRRTPTARADLKVPTDASCRDASDATLRSDPAPSAFAVGMRRGASRYRRACGCSYGREPSDSKLESNLSGAHHSAASSSLACTHGQIQVWPMHDGLHGMARVALAHGVEAYKAMTKRVVPYI